MTDITRQSDVAAAGREGGLQQQPLSSAKAKAAAAYEQEKEQARLAAAAEPSPTTAIAPLPAVAAPTPTTTAPLRPSPISLTPALPEEVLTKTATRAVDVIPPAHTPPGAGLAAAVASAVPSAVLRHAPAAIAGPLAATAAQMHIPGGGAAAVRVPLAAVGNTVTTTWGECEPSVKSLVARTFAGAWGATISGSPHPPNLSLSSPSRASAAERNFAANVTWDGSLLYLRGRERARVAPRLMSFFFESAAFVPRVVTLALVGSSPSTAAAVVSGEWGPGAPQQQQGMMAPAGAEPTAGAMVGELPPGLGRIDVEGTLYLMIKPALHRLLPFGIGRALLPIDVPISGVWSIVARPADDCVISMTDRPANWIKPPRLLRALWGMAATNVALVFTRW